jgi:hypothetical protein
VTINDVASRLLNARGHPMKHVNLQNSTITMAGNLSLPEGLSEGKKYPALAQSAIH